MTAIKPFTSKTPVLTCQSLNELLGCTLYFKCENFQKTGSFKARGAIYKAQQVLKEQKPKGFVTHSYGNHGGAVAYAGKCLNMPTHIVMPSDAPFIKQCNVKAYDGVIEMKEPNLQIKLQAVKQ